MYIGKPINQGVSAKRRDYCALLQKTFVTARSFFMKTSTSGGKKAEERAVKFIQAIVQQLHDQAVQLEDLVMSATLNAKYDPKRAPPKHVPVVKKRLDRNPADIVHIGERVHFIMIDPIAEPKRGKSEKSIMAKGEIKTYMRAEDPAYVKAHHIPYSASYYANDQLKKPLAELMTWVLYSDQIIKPEDADFMIDDTPQDGERKNVTQAKLKKAALSTHKLDYFVQSLPQPQNHNNTDCNDLNLTLNNNKHKTLFDPNIDRSIYKKARYTYEQAYEKTAQLLFEQAKKRVVHHSFTESKQSIVNNNFNNNSNNNSNNNDSKSTSDTLNKNLKRKNPTLNGTTTSTPLKNNNILKFMVTNYSQDELKQFINQVYDCQDELFNKNKYSELQVVEYKDKRFNIVIDDKGVIQSTFYDNQFRTHEFKKYIGRTYGSIQQELEYYKHFKYNYIVIDDGKLDPNTIIPNNNTLIVKLDKDKLITSIYYHNYSDNYFLPTEHIDQVYNADTMFIDDNKYSSKQVVHVNNLYVEGRLTVVIDPETLLIKDVYYDNYLKQNNLKSKYDASYNSNKKQKT